MKKRNFAQAAMAGLAMAAAPLAMAAGAGVVPAAIAKGVFVGLHCAASAGFLLMNRFTLCTAPQALTFNARRRGTSCL
ncbi:hypothetical protein [Acidithiobacillus thiooxidans]|uniref:hypothetical protein n=1 Tax=Acidithiobacillus thiooxidans TaxID=930 RepID=UPI0004E1FF05|nr:hypothetical protein [Acidithiobacillus thiooxidans]